MMMSRSAQFPHHIRHRSNVLSFDVNNPHLRLLFMHESSSSSSPSSESALSGSDSHSTIDSQSYSTTPSIDNLSFLGRHGYLYSLSSPNPRVPSSNMSTNQIPNENTNTESTRSQTPQSASNTETFTNTDTKMDQYRYHKKLLKYIRSPSQYKMIKTDATISVFLLISWCTVNMGWTVYSEHTDQLIMNQLLLFGITVLIIYRDLLLCNGQWCLPILLLFQFTIRLIIEYVINVITVHNISLNVCFLLITLLATTQRFIFNIFVPKQNDDEQGVESRDIHWDLMRCQLFGSHRGPFRRWMNYLIYVWFQCVMIMQLMDSISVCFGSDDKVQSHFKREGGRRQFVLCDAVLFSYAVGSFALWTRLKSVDHLDLEMRDKLKVESYQGIEALLLAVVLWTTYTLWDTVFTWCSLKNMVLQATVMAVLFINSFVMQ